MAAVVHELWVRGDQSLLIMPGSLPLDAPRVRDELTRYLSDGWNTVVDVDVDGLQSEPYRIDADNPRLGQFTAARRIARTIFLGSAPSVREQRVRGIEDVRVRLGVVQPGEPVALFNDALGRLAERLTYLYGDNRRFWYDLRPNLRRTVEDRAGRLHEHEVIDEIVDRLRKLARTRGDFRGVHVCVPSGDVPDEQEARLVVLSPTETHRHGQTDSPAIRAAADILDHRGSAPRQYRNMLVFVAPDQEMVQALLQETRRCLAWKSVVRDADALNLDAHQRRQANESAARSDETVGVRLPEAYGWLLVPSQEGTEPVRWEVTRIGGTESFVVKVARALKSSEQLITRWSPALLRIELDRWLWRDLPHLGVKQLWEYLTKSTGPRRWTRSA